MSRPIAVFFHGLFFIGDPPTALPNALPIIQQQFQVFRSVGLEDACDYLAVGINGGVESMEVASRVIPAKSEIIMHGLQCRNECRTILEIEKWVAEHPDWYVLYWHCKGATHTNEDDGRTQWRNCMMRNLIGYWQICVRDLDRGLDSVGCHWLTGQGSDRSQNYWAGTFWWATSNYLRTLPSITERARIKMSGIDSFDSRYEAEVWIGTGKRLPRVKDYHPAHPGCGKCQ